VASKFLTTGSDFDALLLVTRAGQVIVERAPSGLQLSRLDSTAFRIAPDQAAAHPGGFEALTGSRSLVDEGTVTHRGTPHQAPNGLEA